MQAAAHVLRHEPRQMRRAWLMPPPSVRESRGTARMRGTRCAATVSGVSARQFMKNLAAGVSAPAPPQAGVSALPCQPAAALLADPRHMPHSTRAGGATPAAPGRKLRPRRALPHRLLERLRPGRTRPHSFARHHGGDQQLWNHAKARAQCCGKAGGGRRASAAAPGEGARRTGAAPSSPCPATGCARPRCPRRPSSAPPAPQTAAGSRALVWGWAGVGSR